MIGGRFVDRPNGGADMAKPKGTSKSRVRKASGLTPAQAPKATKGFAMAFGTPVIAHPWPDSDGLNKELAALILAKEAESDGMVRSNVGGWHSDLDFFEWGQPCIDTLKTRVEELTIELMRAISVVKEGKRAFKYRLTGWANVSRNGDYNGVHNHPNCLWSGTYYVQPGKPAEGHASNGKLELLDPRTGVQMISTEGTVLAVRYLVDPLPGLMVMFPAWLNHMVHPFYGEGERISIAFNVFTLEDKSAAV